MYIYVVKLFLVCCVNKSENFSSSNVRKNLYIFTITIQRKFQCVTSYIQTFLTQLLAENLKFHNQRRSYPHQHPEMGPGLQQSRIFKNRGCLGPQFRTRGCKDSVHTSVALNKVPEQDRGRLKDPPLHHSEQLESAGSHASLEHSNSISFATTRKC